jgi:hypothetical protein
VFTLVYIAFAVWPLVTISLFATLGPRRGLIASMIGGFLFLPFVSIPIADGIPPVTKGFVTTASALVAVLAFDPQRITNYRFHWLDSFVLAAWFGWGVSSLVNGLGIQQALLEWWYYAFWAAIPYFLGRAYLDSPEALRDLAVGIVVFTMIYAVFAVIEMRVSPQFHRWVYGVAGARFHMAQRMGGWRPRVFQFHGLSTSMWFAAGAVVAWGVLFAKSRHKVFGVPMVMVAPVLSIVSLACRSGGAMALMVIGSVIVVGIHRIKRWSLALIVPAFVLLYLFTGLVGPVIPMRKPMVDASRVVFGDVRASSLEFRVVHEEALVWRGMQSPVFGWGGWGRNRLEREDAIERTGRRQAITDGFWIIAFGKYGLVGLIGTYGWMLLPASLAVIQLIRLRAGPSIGFVVVGLSLWSTMYAADQLLNGFTHLVQGLVAGALASFAIMASRVRRGGHVGRVGTARVRPTGPPSLPSTPPVRPAALPVR